MKIHLIAPLLCCLHLAGWSQNRITRLDMFDRVDNHLLFVVFDYDTNGINTSRSVYMADSTFVRTTILTRDGQGMTTRETSHNFDSVKTHTTTLQHSSGTTSFSILDLSSLDLLGGAVQCAPAAAANTWNFTQRNAPAYSARYDLNDDGTPARIVVKDGQGATQFYATVTVRPLTGTLSYHPTAATAPRIHNRGNGRWLVSLPVRTAADLSIDLYSLTGRHLSTLARRGVKAGQHNLSIDVPHSNRSGSGVFVIRVSLDGVTVISGKAVVK